MKQKNIKNLSDVCELVIDCEHKTAPTQETGYPSIRTPNIGRGRLILENVNRVSEETYKEWTKRAIPQAEDLILAREAPVGNVAIISKNLKVCLGQRTVLIRANREKINPYYLVYLLLDDKIQGKIKSISNGATVHHLNIKDIRNLELPELPLLSTQKKIAFILSNYDDVIENNTRRIEILEQMAKLVYEEWFVKFRFPGHEKVKIVSSELGEIPEGWRVEKLEKIADINELNLKKGEEPQEINYIDISSVSTGKVDDTKFTAFSDAPSRARRIVKHGDIIWSTVRPNRKSFALILNPLPNLIVSTGFAVITARSIPYTYLYHALTTDDFVGYLTNNATGAAYPAVNTDDFKNANILVPPDELLDKFNGIVSDLFNLKHNLLDKNQNLSKTRDLLLPKLISGEIDVSDLDIRIRNEFQERSFNLGEPQDEKGLRLKMG